MSFKSGFESREIRSLTQQVAVSSKSEVRQCWTIVWHMMFVEMARTAVGRTTIDCCVRWCATRCAGSDTAEMTSAESWTSAGFCIHDRQSKLTVSQYVSVSPKRLRPYVMRGLQCLSREQHCIDTIDTSTTIEIDWQQWISGILNLRMAAEFDFYYRTFVNIYWRYQNFWGARPRALGDGQKRKSLLSNFQLMKTNYSRWRK